MTEHDEVVYVFEDDPPPTGARWYCRDEPVSFDDVEEAIRWALGRAPTVILRTIGEVFYWAGSAPADPSDLDARPWPPPPEERAEIDSAYDAASRAADDQEAARRRHEELRDAWLRELAPEWVGQEPTHRAYIEMSDEGSVELEEFTPDLCAAWNTETSVSGFGTAPGAIAQVSGLAASDPWVQAVVAALARERSWRSNRRQYLEVRLGRGELFHLTFAANRDSIRTHGLDWTRMTGRGIAGSGGPELDAIFLGDSIGDVDFFGSMTEEPVDIWAVRVDGLWIESGPDGWWVVNEPIPAASVRLVAVSGDTPGLSDDFSGLVGPEYKRTYRPPGGEDLVHSRP